MIWCLPHDILLNTVNTSHLHAVCLPLEGALKFIMSYVPLYFFCPLRFVLADVISFFFYCKIISIDAPVCIISWLCKDKIITLLYLIRVQRDGEVWKRMLAFIILSCILFVLLSRWYSMFTILFCCWIIIVIISLYNYLTWNI